MPHELAVAPARPPFRVARDADQDLDLHQKHPTGTDPVTEGDHDG
jgi:hypothetical protein